MERPTRFGVWLSVQAGQMDKDPHSEIRRALSVADQRVPTDDRWDVWNSPLGRSGDTRAGAVWPVMGGDPQANAALLEAVHRGAEIGRTQCLYTSLPSPSICNALAFDDSPIREQAIIQVANRYAPIITCGVRVLIFDGACSRIGHARLVSDALRFAGFDHLTCGAEPLCDDWAGPRLLSSGKAETKIRRGELTEQPADAPEVGVICTGMEDAGDPKKRGPSTTDLYAFAGLGLRIIVGNLSPEPRAWVRQQVLGPKPVKSVDGRIAGAAKGGAS